MIMRIEQDVPNTSVFNFINSLYRYSHGSTLYLIELLHSHHQDIPVLFKNTDVFFLSFFLSFKSHVVNCEKCQRNSSEAEELLIKLVRKPWLRTKNDLSFQKRDYDKWGPELPAAELQGFM